MIEPVLYLGIIETKQHTPQAPTMVRPLAEARGAAWVQLVEEERMEIFSSRGLVSWFSPAQDAEEGTPWLFRLEEQPNFDPAGNRPERYRLKWTPAPEMPIEILDWRDQEYQSTSEALRLLLMQDGFRLPYQPSRQVMIWLNEATWIGPLHLVPNGNHQRWVVETGPTEDLIVEVWSPTSAASMALLPGAFTRRVIAPHAKRQRLGRLDWGPHKLFLRRLASTMQKVDAEFAEQASARNLTKASLRELVEWLAHQVTILQEDHVQPQQKERARQLFDSFAQGHAILAEVQTELLQIPAVQELLEAERTRVAETTENHVETVLADKLNEIQALQIEAAALQQLLAALKQELATLRLQRETQLLVLEQDLAARLEEIMVQPARLLADVALLRTAFNIQPAIHRESTSSPPSTTSPAPARPTPHSTVNNAGGRWDINAEQAQPHTGDLQELWAKLQRQLLNCGAPTGSASLFLEALLRRRLPVVTGSGALDALAAVAATLTGNRLLWWPVTPTTVAPSDLLGRLDPTTQYFQPYLAGMYDLLDYAQASDDLYLIVLDGINRAAIDSYLLPILTWYGALDASPYQWLPLPMAHIREDSETEGPRAQLRWPANVLLAATLAEGVATLPPPGDLWTKASLIALDHYTVSPETLIRNQQRQRNRLPSSEVNLATWEQWGQTLPNLSSEDAFEPLLNCLETLQSRGVALRPALLQRSIAFYGFHVGAGASPDAVLEDWLAACIIPYAASTHQTSHLQPLLEQYPSRLQQLLTTYGEVFR